MKFFNKLFNKTKIKMEKIEILLALHSYYVNTNTDSSRLAKVATKIDELTDELVGKTVSSAPKQDTPVKQENKEQNKSDQPVKQAPTAQKPQEIKKAEEKKPEEPKKEPAKAVPVEAKEEEPEGVIEFFPFYPCKVSLNNGKFIKDVNVTAPRSFRAFKNADIAKQMGDIYPDIDTLEMVFDEAWTMLCEDQPNKAVVVKLRKDLSSYYSEIKSDSDWYNKVVNPMKLTIQLIKKIFGYKADDSSVVVTRPTEEGLELTIATDCFVKKAATEAKKPEEKKEMKTVQTSSAQQVKQAEKVTPKTEDKRVDEEAQEATAKEMPIAEEEGLDDELAQLAEEEKKDNTKPPAVNKFENFDGLEKLVFGKYLEGSKLASGMKDEASKKAILIEKRNEARLLIQSNYEEAPWTENTPDGRWNPELLNYHNAIIAEISANRAKWPK